MLASEEATLFLLPAEDFLPLFGILLSSSECTEGVLLREHKYMELTRTLINTAANPDTVKIIPTVLLPSWLCNSGGNSALSK